MKDWEKVLYKMSVEAAVVKACYWAHGLGHDTCKDLEQDLRDYVLRHWNPKDGVNPASVCGDSFIDWVIANYPDMESVIRDALY